MVKLVYWGGAMSGKTTSVKFLFHSFNSDKLLHSIETSTGRTLFFDYGELILNRGQWEFHVNVWTATGQDFYCETRPTVLAGVDGIIFVADSNPELLQDNLKSWIELTSILGAKIKSIPIIFCLNKRDLNNKLTCEEFQKALGIKGKFNVVETIATHGENVLKTFQLMIKSILEKN